MIMILRNELDMEGFLFFDNCQVIEADILSWINQSRSKRIHRGGGAKGKGAGELSGSAKARSALRYNR